MGYREGWWQGPGGLYVLQLTNQAYGPFLWHLKVDDFGGLHPGFWY